MPLAHRLEINAHGERPLTATTHDRLAETLFSYDPTIDPTATGVVQRPSADLRRPRGRRALSAHPPAPVDDTTKGSPEQPAEIRWRPRPLPLKPATRAAPLPGRDRCSKPCSLAVSSRRRLGPPPDRPWRRGRLPAWVRRSTPTRRRRIPSRADEADGARTAVKSAVPERPRLASAALGGPVPGEPRAVRFAAGRYCLLRLR